VDGRTGEAIITSADAGKYQQTWRDPITGTTQTRMITGTGVGRTFELIIDPTTTHILATEYFDEGEVTEYTVNVSQGVVNSVR
jgi:gamma-glutamyltranspeptidase